MRRFGLGRFEFFFFLDGDLFHLKKKSSGSSGAVYCRERERVGKGKEKGLSHCVPPDQRSRKHAGALRLTMRDGIVQSEESMTCC